jgi:hypothetical protein
LGEAPPGDIAPVGRDIFVERLMLLIQLIEKFTAALPGQRGALPGLGAGELGGERVAFFLVVRCQQQL